LKAISLRPEILSHFTDPKVLEVADTRSSEALIQAAWDLPEGTARYVAKTIKATREKEAHDQ
jgi:hypothetical protein